MNLLYRTILILSCTAALCSAAEPPNVIIILTDDQGYQDLGCYGSPDIKTPNIDQLAQEGMSQATLTEAFATASERDDWQKGQPRSLKDKVPLMRNEQCIEFPADQSSITRRYTDEAIDFVTRSAKENKPFFLYLAHSMPHTPLFASPDFEGKSARGLYGDVIEEIDFN